MNKILFFLFLFQWVSAAEPLIPPSYFAIEKCWPEILDPQFKKSISLEKLREKIDIHWSSRKKVNLSKIWTLKDPAGVRKRLILKTKPTPPGSLLKDTQTLSLEKLDQHNVGEGLSLPAEHRQNPSQKIINSYLISSEIEQEETETLDIKINQFELRLVSLKNGLRNLKLMDPKTQKTLRCEVNSQVGLVCMCLSK